MKQTKYIVKPTTQLTIEHRTAAGITSAAVSILFCPLFIDLLRRYFNNNPLLFVGEFYDIWILNGFDF